MSLRRWIFRLIVFVFFLEIVVQFLVDKLRLKFPWLITKKKDFFPEIDANGLKKFLADGFDPDLGWVRKPNSQHPEMGKFGKTAWHTNHLGARLNPGFEELPVRIACFGDSFTFCRQVNDDETWEHYLSYLTNTNVLNWGVGNHGIDQSFLRLQREYRRRPADVIIVGVVPDTISRILSTWKHFYEYGNIFGFKPRFCIKNGDLFLIKNPIDSEEKFHHIEKFLCQLRKTDYFYEKKFLQEMISFPYLFSILKNPFRNLPLIYWNCMALICEDSNRYTSLAKQKIMDINLDWRLKLYKDSQATDLLEKITFKISEFARENNFKLVVAFLPQKDDVIYLKTNDHFYQHALDNLRKQGVFAIDLAPNLVKSENLNELYSEESIYGGHFSKFGNNLVANCLFEVLKANAFI